MSCAAARAAAAARADASGSRAVGLPTIAAQSAGLPSGARSLPDERPTGRNRPSVRWAVGAAPGPLPDDRPRDRDKRSPVAVHRRLEERDVVLDDVVHRERLALVPPVAAVERRLARLAVGFVGVGPGPDERAGLAIHATERDVSAAILVATARLGEELDPRIEHLGPDPIAAKLGDHGNLHGSGWGGVARGAAQLCRA